MKNYAIQRAIKIIVTFNKFLGMIKNEKKYLHSVSKNEQNISYSVCILLHFFYNEFFLFLLLSIKPWDVQKQRCADKYLWNPKLHSIANSWTFVERNLWITKVYSRL